MDDQTDVRLEDLYLNEIQELLAQEGQEVSDEQVQMIVNFVKEAGSLEEALAILSDLRSQRDAA